MVESVMQLKLIHNNVLFDCRKQKPIHYSLELVLGGGAFQLNTHTSTLPHNKFENSALTVYAKYAAAGNTDEKKYQCFSGAPKAAQSTWEYLR